MSGQIEVLLRETNILLDHCIHDELEDFSMPVIRKGFHVVEKFQSYFHEKSLRVWLKSDRM
jgi:hypothetical protein